MIEPRRNQLTNNSKPIFSWANVRNARAYEIFIALDPDFSQIISSQIVSGTNFSPTSALIDGIYFWKLRAYNPDLLPGKFSTTQAFTIDTTPPSPPELVSPLNNSTSPKRPWLQWNVNSDAAQFQIEMDNNVNFSNPEFSGLEKNNYVRAKSLPRGIYYWNVRARDAAGNWSNWSPTFVVQFP
jgi:hypothetical protein